MWKSVISSLLLQRQQLASRAGPSFCGGSGRFSSSRCWKRAELLEVCRSAGAIVCCAQQTKKLCSQKNFRQRKSSARGQRNLRASNHKRRLRNQNPFTRPIFVARSYKNLYVAMNEH